MADWGGGELKVFIRSTLPFNKQVKFKKREKQNAQQCKMPAAHRHLTFQPPLYVVIPVSDLGGPVHFFATCTFFSLFNLKSPINTCHHSLT